MSNALLEEPRTKSCPAGGVVRGRVTDAHVAFYREYGFLVYEDAFAREEIEELRRVALPERQPKQ